MKAEGQDVSKKFCDETCFVATNCVWSEAPAALACSSSDPFWAGKRVRCNAGKPASRCRQRCRIRRTPKLWTIMRNCGTLDGSRAFLWLRVDPIVLDANLNGN